MPISDFSTKWIKVSEPFPYVAHVELSRGPVNAFSTEYWREYGKVFENLKAAHGHGSDIRVVVLSSVFTKIFTAGLDLGSAAKLAAAGTDKTEDSARSSLAIRRVMIDFQDAINAPDRCPFPVIVALHGSVVGLGLHIISACDIRYAASNSSFCIKEVDIGLAPDIGALGHLPKSTGNLSLVRELTYTCRPFSAEEAERFGLVSKVVEGGRVEVISAAMDLAKVIASKSPIAVAGSKEIISHARDHSVKDNLEYTAAWNAAALLTRDISENLRAIKAKERPKFTPVGVPSKL